MYQLQPLTHANDAPASGLPVLAGERRESLFVGAKRVGTCGVFSLETAGCWRIGRASVPVERGCEQVTRELYRDLLQAAAGRQLCRIWHFVPRINEQGYEGMENYRAFCRGRSLAFEDAWGKTFESRLPAASAVGTEATELTVVFASCDAPVEMVENPVQVPAYRYPCCFGPRAPSFSRASVVKPRGEASRVVFISGTAAVVGSETVSAGNTDGQTVCTLENLERISEACGLGATLGREQGVERHFKVYLRKAEDLGRVKAALERRLFLPTDHVTYLRSDICRADLNLEIEATIF